MNYILCLFIIAVTLPAFIAAKLYTGSFSSKIWRFNEKALSGTRWIRFTVALNLRNTEQMHEHFQEVSNPLSPNYGKYVTSRELDALYGPTPEDKQAVRDYFQSIPESTVTLHDHGDLMEVLAPIEHVEAHLRTSLGVVTHAHNRIAHQAIRAKTDLSIPENIASKISFVSLNAPVNHVKPRAAKSLRDMETQQTKSSRNNHKDKVTKAAAATTPSVTQGNEEAIVGFYPQCSDGSANNANPPCAGDGNPPVFTFSVSTYNSDLQNLYTLTTDPTDFTVKAGSVYCMYPSTTTACDGSTTNGACKCFAKLSPLPKYVQLQANVSETFPSGAVTQLGATSLFALTDVATASFLSNLYQMPPGVQVNHGSNQSVAEFYGEFYSNKDLEQFFALSGLPNNTISTAENYYIDLPNDQSNPGGEAQLDVEYIMALAPNAPTFFYSIGTYNPNDPVNTTSHNEGFLSYLQLVESQEYPPLVHSLSYGDVEAEIFNASHNGSVAYGDRCNQEFMQLGLRGLTLLFSSGDDGIGSSQIRDDPVGACRHAVPEWPASSPYVTAVGATQLTDKYLPACEKTYYTPGLPVQFQNAFQCTGTGETVCTSVLGGVITSGGGFSDVTNRSYAAPWQSKAVDYYLRQANAAAYPPLSYFNPQGRAYPDVATYGSNYFVYLNGVITRESGTSASAPVFAAMVTLWNDIRLANNMPPMGFIAPFLYAIAEKNPEAFHDIVTGNNACGAGRSLSDVNCCENFFAAVPGWDAVTGLGSPNFQVIANLVINNMSSFPSLGAYPAGVAQTITVEGNNDNDDGMDHVAVRDTAIAAIVVGTIALISVCILFVVFRKKKSSEGLLNDSAGYK